jgi:hypothetical protein
MAIADNSFEELLAIPTAAAAHATSAGRRVYRKCHGVASTPHRGAFDDDKRWNTRRVIFFLPTVFSVGYVFCLHSWGGIR